MHVYDDITPEKVSSLSLSHTHTQTLNSQNTNTTSWLSTASWVIDRLKLGHLFQAQAIMLLAGNGSIASNAAHPKAQVQAPSSKLAAADGVTVNQPINTHPCSGLSSPLSVSSHTGAQSGSGSTGNDESMAAKTAGAPTTPVSKAVPLQMPKMVVPFPSGKTLCYWRVLYIFVDLKIEL